MTVVLLFEDEKILRENTQELLKAHGFDCECAEHGKECLKLTLEIRPDMILCDIMLPFLSGYHIKEQLNGNAETANIPFIFLSAKIDNVDKDKGFKLGADDYVVKPYRINELINSIEKVLAQKRSL